jgi:hypothetical protein
VVVGMILPDLGQEVCQPRTAGAVQLKTGRIYIHNIV